MNKEWSLQNKLMQQQLKKNTYPDGIHTLINLRNEIMDEFVSWKNEMSFADFSAIPFINANGYHCKTLAYSLWHIFRIEDIVTQTLIKNEEQILFSGDYVNRIHTPIITTGNELVKEEIADFSKQLDIEALYQYIFEVKASTENWLREITYIDLKRKFDEADEQRIQQLQVVSDDENAIWLIDYWCNKDIKGLIQMPMSRHWIMHAEAGIRIKDKLCNGR